MEVILRNIKKEDGRNQPKAEQFHNIAGSCLLMCSTLPHSIHCELSWPAAHDRLNDLQPRKQCLSPINLSCQWYRIIFKSSVSGREMYI